MVAGISGTARLSAIIGGNETAPEGAGNTIREPHDSLELTKEPLMPYSGTDIPTNATHHANPMARARSPTVSRPGDLSCPQKETPAPSLAPREDRTSGESPNVSALNTYMIPAANVFQYQEVCVA